MKFFFASLLLAFLSIFDSPACYAVTLAWDASPDATITGYRIYWGTVSGQPTMFVDVGNVTQTPIPNSNFSPGVAYFFTATATGPDEESLPSNEVRWTYLPPALTSLATSAGTLNPPFAAGITSYALSTPNAMATVTITATGTGTITINGVATASGQASAAIPLNVGANTIYVTTSDTGSSRAYTLAITRGKRHGKPSNLRVVGP